MSYCQFVCEESSVSYGIQIGEVKEICLNFFRQIFFCLIARLAVFESKVKLYIVPVKPAPKGDGVFSGACWC